MVPMVNQWLTNGAGDFLKFRAFLEGKTAPKQKC